jgi:hypothetical protein
MVTKIREEFFLVEAVDQPSTSHYHHFRERNRFSQNRATALNTLPPDYDSRVKRYNRNFVEVWNTEKQQWENVAVPAYAEDIVYDDVNEDVVDVYDTETGTYKKRIERLRCGRCGKRMNRCLYVVKHNKVIKVCGTNCAEKVKKSSNFTPYKELVKEVEKSEDLSAFACKVCGKIPSSIENAIASISTEGEPESSTLYMLACGFECALKLKEEYNKRKEITDEY